MIINIKELTSSSLYDQLTGLLTELRITFYKVTTQSDKLLVLGDVPSELTPKLERLLGSSQALYHLSSPHRLVMRDWKPNTSAISIGDTKIGGAELSIIMGPCAVQTSRQMERISDFLNSKNVSLIRGGGYKPRSTPYVFQGYGVEALKMMREISNRYSLHVISEVLEPTHVEDAYDYIDIFQVGTRNAQNQALLRALGNVEKPVLLKRGFGNTIEEFLGAAEYLYSFGNERIILCERGVRGFERSYRNILDINSIPFLKQRSHLPVVVDPSHGTGIKDLVEPIALAAVAAGADGIMIEMSDVPEESLTDSAQTLSFNESAQLIDRVRRVRSCVEGFYE